MKTKERELARQLRLQEGLSMKEIARRLDVSQASVSLWVRDIELSAEQEREMMMRAYGRQRQARDAIVTRRRSERAESQRHGRQLARKGDPIHAAGCMLYWAEGSKDRNSAKITNSDPELLRYFLSFLRRFYDVEDHMVRVTCHLFADHLDRQREIEHHWLDQLGLTEVSLRKSIVNVYSSASQRKRVNLLPYGTCHMTVSRTHIVQSIYGSIQEYAGFDRPEWLDC